MHLLKLGTKEAGGGGGVRGHAPPPPGKLFEILIANGAF